MQTTEIHKDIAKMHAHFGIDKAVEVMSKEKQLAMLKFRFKFIQEELTEGRMAINEMDSEEIVDSLIDQIVVAIGTLDLYKVDFPKAWNNVLDANMAKEAGVNPHRKNPLGLPDLCKPKNWEAPCHKGNHGTLPELF